MASQWGIQVDPSDLVHKRAFKKIYNKFLPLVKYVCKKNSMYFFPFTAFKMFSPLDWIPLYDHMEVYFKSSL